MSKNKKTEEKCRKKNNVVKNNVAKNNAAKNNVAKNNVTKNNVAKNNAAKNNVAKNNAAKNNVTKNNAAKNNVAKNNVAKNNVAKNNVAKNNVTKNNESKNNGVKNNGVKNGGTKSNRSKNSVSVSSRSKNNAAAGNGYDSNRNRNNKSRQQDKKDWREFIYNCPYLLAVVMTSLVVMVCSDEIGFKAVARETKSTVMQTMGRKILSEKTESVLSAQKNFFDEHKKENLSSNDSEETKNAGECKEDVGNIEGDLERENVYDNAQNPGNTDKNLKGVTNFEIYEPQEIESYYYSDAGKVALTTEYPYTKENISYFDDAAFLGDSRTLGISDYAGLDEADFYCDSGMMIFKLLEEGVTYQKTSEKVDLTQVLQEKQYGKIYIMLGMNELGYGNTDMYLEKYREVVEQIRDWQPNAVIYIMANLHVSREKNDMETEFNNININDKNAASATLANGTDIFYLDANPLFTDQDGFLNDELTFDGVHLFAQHYDVWREFLLEHAVEPVVDMEESGSDGEEIK